MALKERMIKSILKTCLNVLIIVISNVTYSSDLTGEYLGQKPPGDSARVFAPGIVSTIDHEHSSPVFSADGDEVYWSVWSKDGSPQIIKYMNRINGEWKLPKPLNISGQYKDGGPFLSSDDSTLYFYSKRPIVGETEKDNDIWFSKRKGSTWSTPINLTSKLKTDQFMPTITRRGILYFVSHYPGVQGEYGIYRSDISTFEELKLEALASEINSKYYDWCPFIAPDESYLIFSSSRPGGKGSFDLYICYKQEDSNWSTAMNLGEKINTSRQERFPYISPDGKYFFFTRATERNQDDIFWISSEVLFK